MSGTRKHYVGACVVCGREREPDETFSARGKCPDCGERLLLDNVRQMVAHEGPQWQSWRRAMARSVGAELPAELLDENT